MTTHYNKLEENLLANSRKWLVTGAAGFIGSHLLQRLLELKQEVIAVDNFSTGKRDNLKLVEKLVGEQAWIKCKVVELDVNETDKLTELLTEQTIVLHQAALGSVPRSIESPLATHQANINGFLSVLLACKEAKVPRLVYASSSSVYGDIEGLPKYEEKIGRPLSPYALSKLVNEYYAEQFSRQYQLESIGLRYFNVFGPRQDPEGAYAAVVPRWFSTILDGKSGVIFGDGNTSRDFCYIENVIQGNLLAACTESKEAINQVYNIACGEQLTLNELYSLIHLGLKRLGFILPIESAKPEYKPFRSGDIRHSLASIRRAREFLRYEISVPVRVGLTTLCEHWLHRIVEEDPEILQQNAPSSD